MGDRHAGGSVRQRSGAWTPPRRLCYFDLRESLGTHPSSIHPFTAAEVPVCQALLFIPSCPGRSPYFLLGGAGRSCPCARPLGRPPHLPGSPLHSDAPRGPGWGQSREQQGGPPQSPSVGGRQSQCHASLPPTQLHRSPLPSTAVSCSLNVTLVTGSGTSVF